jgi:hypothetical protein
MGIKKSTLYVCMSSQRATKCHIVSATDDFPTTPPEHQKAANTCVVLWIGYPQTNRTHVRRSTHADSHVRLTLRCTYNITVSILGAKSASPVVAPPNHPTQPFPSTMQFHVLTTHRRYFPAVLRFSFRVDEFCRGSKEHKILCVTMHLQALRLKCHSSIVGEVTARGLSSLTSSHPSLWLEVWFVDKNVRKPSCDRQGWSLCC